MNSYLTPNPNLMLLAAGSLVVSGCCFGCVEPENSYTIDVGFSADSLGGTGFTKREVQSVYAVVYAQPGFMGVNDTMRYTGLTTYSGRELYIYPSIPNKQFYISLYGQRNTPLSYRIFVPVTGKTFDIDSISDIYTESKGSCKCQYVSAKRFTINGQPQVQPVPDGNNRPAINLPR